MTWFLLVPVALAAGTAVSMQFGVNSQLRTVAGGPVAAAAISFIVGTVALVALTLVLNGGLPSFGDVSNAPWWVWTGGLLGAFYVFASVILTPRLGAATTVALILTGQVLASIAIDHFGLFRVAAQEATPLRLLGALLIVAGVLFVQRF
jgi:transporter family-2 protein